MMFKNQKEKTTSRPQSRSPASKKPKIDARDDPADKNSNPDDEHGSLFCTSK